MELYKAIDKLDNTESFFLVYPNGRVAVMLICSVDIVKYNQKLYATDPAIRFELAENPVLLEEW